MHTAAYEKLGLPHRYSYVETSNFEDIHEVFQAKDLAGVAVTLPYKSRVLGMLDHVSEEARQIGAVNTVLVERRNESGANSKNLVLRGHNTDHIGLRECICRNISPANSIRPNSSVLIIGAGGMARAALYACRELGVKQGCVWNRTVENAETLVKATSWSSMELVVLRNEQDSWPAHLSQPTIVISTIPAHRLDQRPAHELNIPSNWLQSRTGGVFMEVRTPAPFCPCLPTNHQN
jgi:shikimate 5-dehydrogenase